MVVRAAFDGADVDRVDLRGSRDRFALRGGRRIVSGHRSRLCLSAGTTGRTWSICRRHARFFILLTVVFGAITGVGIWWTIGLASPLATEVLIRTFVFGWAMEYVFFVLEIVSAFIFYYYWDRLPPAIHTAIGWIYAVSAWMSLVLITGITAFMLRPGEPGWGPSRQLLAGMLESAVHPANHRPHRRGAAAQLAVRVSPRFADGQGAAPARLDPGPLVPAGVVRRGAGYHCGGVLWYHFLPDSARVVCQAAGVLNVFMGLIFALTARYSSCCTWGRIATPVGSRPVLPRPCW